MNYYRKQSQQYWLQQNKYMQAMIALSLFRTGDIKIAKDILASLKQNAIVNEETGMYWKEISGGYYWYQSPVETESLLIEAFREISKDEKSVDNMKTWLLKQKQAQAWKTTKATADACYGLLLQGSDLLAEEKSIQIRLGNTVISSSDNNAQAGTGYFKKVIDGNLVKPEMGNINVTISNQSTNQQINSSSWGSVYWQYFENTDKITSSSTPLQLTKKLFVEKNTDRGIVIEPIEENATVKIGDKIKVRIELRADRDMEYVHMKDMRASCMEPVNVLSEYKWQGGLGYYESTKDASTNFFFGWLPKGTYVFEYTLFVTAAGNFSNGITTIQCMYAPEFTSHSEGFRIIKAAVSAREGVPPRPGGAGPFTGTPAAQEENTHETGQPSPPRRASGRSRHRRRRGGDSVQHSRRQSRRCRHPALTGTVSVSVRGPDRHPARRGARPRPDRHRPQASLERGKRPYRLQGRGHDGVAFPPRPGLCPGRLRSGHPPARRPRPMPVPGHPRRARLLRGPGRRPRRREPPAGTGRPLCHLRPPAGGRARGECADPGALPLSAAEAAGQRTDDLVPTGVIRPRGRRESPGAFPSTCHPELKELAVNRPASRKKTP